MKTYNLDIANELCWGCKTCEVACKQENGTPSGVKLIVVGEDRTRAKDGSPHLVFTVNRCRHCEDAPCLAACIIQAIQRRDDGIVVLDEEECSGCRACLEVCPYEAIAFDDERDTATKCNLCHHRIDRGLLPACADNVCLAHCICLAETDSRTAP